MDRGAGGTMSAEAAPEPPEARDYIRYGFYHLRPEWRRRPAPERAEGRRALAGILASAAPPLTLRTYSTVGTKAGVEALVWMSAPAIAPIQEMESRIWGSPLGGYLEQPYAYFGMTRRSEYLAGHQHEGQESTAVTPSDKPYLVVYPFVKKRAWYGLTFEDRRRIMGEHFRVGHRYPDVDIHTGYSFGLDDAEFILAFEMDDPGRFLDLVQALRPSEASRYTEIETPIFTALRTTPERMLALADGLPPA